MNAKKSYGFDINVKLAFSSLNYISNIENSQNKSSANKMKKVKANFKI